MDVRRVGDGDPQTVADERDRDGDDPLQRAQRDQLERIGRDARLAEVEIRHAVTPRQRARDPVRLGIALVDNRLCERARAGAAADGGETVGREQLRGRDELGDEVRDRVETALVGGRGCRERCLLAAAGCRSQWARVQRLLPRKRHRQPRELCQTPHPRLK